jgi:hypothetical protein
MATRDPDLQAFVEVACQAFTEFAQGCASRRSVARICSALERSDATDGPAGARLPVCDYLGPVAAPDRFTDPVLRKLAAAFVRIEPRLAWRRRPTWNASASENFAEGHANAMIVGPGGLEPSASIQLGVSLLGPNVRYPDHRHPPEETYLVMSDGEFSQRGGPWFRPGIGGSFYNEPGITHAMRSLGEPLLAFWALWAEPSAASA